MTAPGLLAAEVSGGPPAFMHDLTALVVAAALIAYLALRARQVPIVGLLVARVLIGPRGRLGSALGWGSSVTCPAVDWRDHVQVGDMQRDYP